MKQRIKLSEGDLRKIVLESVRTVLNEDFNNDELTNMVREHGGLATGGGYRSTSDARAFNYTDNIANMRPKGYIEPDQIEILDMFDWFEPIQEQVLWCNDGGIIVVKDDTSYTGPDNGKRVSNLGKMHKRLNNYLDDKGEDKYQYIGVDKFKNMHRRIDHMNKRGVKTTGPNAGKKTGKKR